MSRRLSGDDKHGITGLTGLVAAVLAATIAPAPMKAGAAVVAFFIGLVIGAALAAMLDR